MHVQISVIVPIYNTEQYLRKCLDSILAQNERNIEVIAVNNGCTDSSGEILTSYAAADNRIKIVNRLHGDIFAARNDGLLAAKGEYVAFCDSDDTVPPKAYSKLLKKAETSGCDVVVGGYFEIDERTGASSIPINRRGGSGFGLLMRTPCLWNKLIRRDFISRHNLTFPHLSMGEDMIFLGKLFKCSPTITRIKQPIYCYWMHTKSNIPSITHRYELALFKQHIQCHKMLLDEYKDTQYKREVEIYVYCSLIDYLRNFLFRIWDGNERKEAFELFREHVLTFDWGEYEERFARMFEMSVSQFRTIPAEVYITQLVNFDHRKVVLNEYKAGTIGFRYILKYFAAWVEFKLSVMKSN